MPLTPLIATWVVGNHHSDVATQNKREHCNEAIHRSKWNIDHADINSVCFIRDKKKLIFVNDECKAQHVLSSLC